LVTANAEADRATVARATGRAEVASTFKPDPTAADFNLKGYAFTRTASAVSGDSWIQYDPGTPKTYVIPNRNGLLPDISVQPPAAYVVPAPWQEIIARL